MLIYKNTLKKIRHSIGRYLSLFSIICIGVATYAGVRETIPNIKGIQTDYYADHSVMDYKITGTLGLTEDDIKALLALEDVEYAVGSYSLSALAGDRGIKVHALTDQNTVRLIEGRMPEKTDECLAEADFYHLDDTITLDECVDDKDDQHLKTHTFTVVGTITSPLYTNTDYGTIDVGDGVLSSYVYLLKDCFDYEDDLYTEIYLGMKKSAEEIPYAFQYKEHLSLVKEQLNTLKLQREKIRTEEVIGEAQDKLDEAKEELDEETAKADKKIKDAQDKIDKNKKKISDGQKELNSQKKKANAQFAKAKKDLDQASRKLEKNKSKANAAFKKAQAEIDQGKKELKAGYKEYETQKAEVKKQLAPAYQAKSDLEDGIKQSKSALSSLKAQLENPDLDEETRAAINKQIDDLEASLSSLNAQYAEVTKQIDTAEAELKKAKNLLDANKAKLNKAQKQLNKEKKALKDAQKKITKGYQTLAAQKKKAAKEFKKAQAKLNKGKKELKKGQSKLNRNKKKFAKEIKKARIKLEDAQADIDDIEDAKWYILSRDDVISGYALLENQYEEITAIADLFPFFFILVTMLMTSNTMARMIVEERGEMGTLSSLGYSPRAIISTYLAYVLSATLTGSFIGYFVGTLTLPRIIYSVFPLKMPEMSYYCNNAMIIMIMAVTFVVMTIVTVYNCMKELKSVPAALLRPKAPAASSTILLERITWIWKKLSFSWKITMRNLARFKSRAFITILGTMGCSFIILLGFCVRDGINGIGAKQYREFFTYDAIAVLNQGVKNHTTKIEDLTEGYLDHSLLMYQNSCKGIHQDESINFYLIVPENQPDFFRQYFHLRDYKTKEALTLKDGEAIISQKIATKFHLSVGDTLTFEDSDSKSYQVKIGGIAENYVANYLYLTTQTYTRLSHDELKYNIIVGQNRTSQENITQHFLDNDDVVSIQFSRDLISKANGGINGLNHIVIMLVIIASLLAFSVLYNLTSINISERTREIATLKVLGFDDRETNNYVYRETIINILIGIFAALIATTLVWPYMATMFENDNNIFLKEIKPMSYVYTVVISLGFLFVMQGVTYLKIYVIDMIESLKSIE